MSLNMSLNRRIISLYVPIYTYTYIPIYPYYIPVYPYSNNFSGCCSRPGLFLPRETVQALSVRLGRKGRGVHSRGQ